jgi:hypothetical protein
MQWKVSDAPDIAHFPIASTAKTLESAFGYQPSAFSSFFANRRASTSAQLS